MDFHRGIDFLFVDGWHEYQDVKRDCQAWLPKLKPGGIVVLHDSGWAPGVRRVIDEDVRPLAQATSELPNLFWAIRK